MLPFSSESDLVLAASIPRLREEESAVEGESMSTHTLSKKSTNGSVFRFFFVIDYLRGIEGEIMHTG